MCRNRRLDCIADRDLQRRVAAARAIVRGVAVLRVPLRRLCLVGLHVSMVWQAEFTAGVIVRFP
jgi:hypothetical protein